MTSSWIDVLSESDKNFIRNFVLCSGNFRELSRVYDVSYPTIRSKVDKVIAKIEVHSQLEDPFTTRLRVLALEERIPADIVSKITDIFHEEGGNSSG
jgi:hypothetical protein